MRIDPNRGRGGSLVFCSLKRRCTSWSDASNSRNTSPLLREIIWPACSNSPPHRSRSGSRTDAISARGSVRTRPWRWWASLLRDASRCRFWFGMENRAWATRPHTTPLTMWGSITSPTTATLRLVTSRVRATRTTHATIRRACPPSSPHSPTATTSTLESEI